MWAMLTLFLMPMDNLHGRLPIYTSIEYFDPANPQEVITEVNEALSTHALNLEQMEYLYWYRRGITPIYEKEKDIRPEICHKIASNIAGSIVDFKDGYFLTQAATYIPRKGREEMADKVGLLNEFLYRSGKHEADNELVDWFHIVGKADLFVQSVDDEEKPFEAYALDPRSAFVVRSTMPGNKPVYAGYTVIQDGELRVDVWDRKNLYRCKGMKVPKMTSPIKNYLTTVYEVTEILPNPLGLVPIIEYQHNSVWMGAFENAIGLLDAIDWLQSGRLDAVDQFVQSLLVFYNCELGEDSDGNPITPAYVRAAGALFLKSVGENKADLKEISSQLDQSQVQVLVNNLYDTALAICGMPTTSNSFPGDSTGLAIELRDGWTICEMNARNTEDLFKRSNRQFDEIIVKILREKGILDINLADFELHFTRNELRAVQSKAQALNTLIASGLHPTLALAKSGISADPVSEFELSKDFMTLRWGNPEGPKEQPKTEIVEETRDEP